MRIRVFLSQTKSVQICENPRFIEIHDKKLLHYALSHVD